VYGIDFSPTAISLAKQVRAVYRDKEKAGASSEPLLPDISYSVQDILRGTSFTDCMFDLVFDKGTFDSIAMVTKDFAGKGEPQDVSDVQRYCEELKRILKPGKYFMIISCNHDQDELLRVFGEASGVEAKCTACGFKLVKDLTELFCDLRAMIFQKE